MTTPASAAPGMHLCALAPPCEQQIPLKLLMCRPHWALVPPTLQKAVYRCYRTRIQQPEAFRTAVRLAIAAALRALDDAP